MSDMLLDSIVDKYYDKIYNYCFAQLNYSHHDATDCTQEVFFTLLKKKKLTGKTNFVCMHKSRVEILCTFT